MKSDVAPKRACKGRLAAETLARIYVSHIFNQLPLIVQLDIQDALAPFDLSDLLGAIVSEAGREVA